MFLQEGGDRFRSRHSRGRAKTSRKDKEFIAGRRKRVQKATDTTSSAFTKQVKDDDDDFGRAVVVVVVVAAAGGAV